MFIYPHRQQAQGLAEYALILVIVSVAAIALLLLLGQNTGNVYSEVITTIETVSQ
jgi:Flp pilus assembly pilin Flp